MADQVSWMLELAIKPGRLDDFKAVLAEMVESTLAEPGALSYECFISGDGTTVHLYERYADSAAVMTHLGTFGEKFAERFLEAADPTRFTVFGDPSAEARTVLDNSGARYLGFLGGFAR
jgi:quinol monooxygenase YgiN